MKATLITLGYLIGTHFIARAVVELVTIDYGEPSSYRDDWGGPSRAGVLAVHCLPGVVAAVLMVWGCRMRGRRPT